MISRSRKPYLALATLAMCVGPAGTMLIFQARADAQGFEWQAFNENKRVSIGGWLTERAAAEANGCAGKRANPTHTISIRYRHKDASFDSFNRANSNYRC
jgi:hypothetical protein